MTSLRRLHPLLTLLLLSACGGSADTASSAATLADSAGVQIVTSTDPAWAPGDEWRISAAPTLEIGMAQ